MSLNDTRPEGVNNIVFQQKSNLVYCKNIYILNNHFFCTQKYSAAFDNVFQQTIGKPFKSQFFLCASKSIVIYQTIDKNTKKATYLKDF